jgi:hypothetical protein
MGKFIGEVIQIHAGRLSFPELEEAVPFTGNGSSESDRKSFQATMLLDLSNPKHLAAYEKVESEVERAIQEVWDGVRPAKLKIEFYGEGNDRTNAQTGEIYKGYEDMHWVTGKCGEDTPPRLKDKRKNDVEGAEKIRKLFYGGVFVNATVNVYVPDKKWVRICCGLRTVMSLERGDTFGAGATDSEFDDFDADDGDAGVGAPEDDDGLGGGIPF